jgi:hypothetical protein
MRKRKSKKKSARPKIHVIGKIKPEHVPVVAALPVIEKWPELLPPLETDEPGMEPEQIPEEEHVLAAVPVSAWKKFCNFFTD